MERIEINSLPKIVFSHIYKTNNYKAHFFKKENFVEITYIADGELTSISQGKNARYKKGDVLCAFFTNESQVIATDYHCHHTVGASLEWNYADNENSLLIPTYIPAESGTQEICKLIDDFIYNQIDYKNSSIKGATKFLELLCAIDSHVSKKQKTNLPSEILYVEKAKKYIEQNIYNPISQKQIANHLGISCEYLCSIFKKTENTTIINYINKIKLKNIKWLIDNNNLHLYQASAIYGYNDPNYVSKLYKQLFGYNITNKPNIHK